MVNARCLSTSVVTLLFVTTSFAADPDDVGEAVADYTERVGRAQESFEESVATARRVAVDKLAGLAKVAVRRGSLADATRAWQQVLVLDPDHEDARAHFKAIGRLDEALQKARETPLPEPRVPRSPPRAAVTFGGHRYVVSETKLPWELARERAEAMGGYLARIDSREELRFLAKLLADGGSVEYYWIDGRDLEVTSEYRFTNGAKASYFEWGPKQPTDFRGEYYMAISRKLGTMYDSYGGDRDGWIVEWDE